MSVVIETEQQAEEEYNRVAQEIERLFNAQLENAAQLGAVSLAIGQNECPFTRLELIEGWFVGRK